jgi:Heterokaryon incompatibility protein (HET)
MLCEKCEALNLTPDDFTIDTDVDGDMPRYDETYNIGTLSDIYQRSHTCSLCQLFLSATGVRHDTLKHINDERKQASWRLYWKGDGIVYGKHEPQVRILMISVSRSMPNYNEFRQICLHGDDAQQTAEPLFFGRNIPNKINPMLVKKWLKSCQRWHGGNCNESSPSSDNGRQFPQQFRVIDAWQMCIVKPPSNCAYFALSYVWGTAPVMKLTKGNIEDLSRPGGLQHRWHEIPQTIQDSIRLTSSLGRRYIWIDSLCIVQDDIQDKAAMIPIMHLIYERAFLTVVAASGMSAAAGLPGFRKDTRGVSQCIATVRPGLRLVAPKSLSDSLRKSSYETRAWT